MSWDEYIAEFDACGWDGGFATVAWQDFRSTDLICSYRYKGGIFEGLKQVTWYTRDVAVRGDMGDM